MNRDDARPLRSVVFAPGDDADALAATRASGADSMVVDLEEPQTPYPESERERGRKVAPRVLRLVGPRRAAAGVRAVQPPSTGQTLKDLRAVAGPGLAGVLLPKIMSPADVHMLDALLACTEVDFDLAPGQIAIYPILETAQALRLAYEIAMASPRVSHMGGALSRFGDIHQALGYRWTAEGEETLFLRSKVLVDAKAAGIRYPISGMWGGALDDLDGLRAFATSLRNLGYYGMMLGSAEHVPLVHEVFTPTAEEIAYWRELDELATEAERSTADRSATATRARARPTSCTSRTSAPPARTSPGPATSASSDTHRFGRSSPVGGQMVPRSSRILVGGRCWSRTTAPDGRSASAIALQSAAGAPMAPPSPTPRKSIGPCGGDSRWWISMWGISALVGQQVVDERRGEQLAVVVVRGALEQHTADALRDAAGDLALDDRRVDQRAAVLHHEVAVDARPGRSPGRPRPSSSASPATSRPRGWRSRTRRRCRA